MNCHGNIYSLLRRRRHELDFGIAARIVLCDCTI
jgi:hypothetical protein